MQPQGHAPVMTDLADGAPRQVGTRRRAWRAYSMRCRVHRLARIEACPGIAPDFQWFPASDHTTSVLGRHEYRLDKEALIEAVAADWRRRPHSRFLAPCSRSTRQGALTRTAPVRRTAAVGGPQGGERGVGDRFSTAPTRGLDPSATFAVLNSPPRSGRSDPDPCRYGACSGGRAPVGGTQAS